MLVAVSVCAISVPEEAEAPVTLVCVTVHAKVVPATLLVSAIPVDPPEQILCEEGVAVAEGVGLTVTVTVCEAPTHPPVEVGVTVYTTVWAVLELLTIISPIVPLVCVVRLSPLVLGLSPAIHVYVEAVLEVNARLTALPLHIVAVLALVIVGVVLVVTFTVCVTGPQPAVPSLTLRV